MTEIDETTSMGIGLVDLTTSENWKSPRACALGSKPIIQWSSHV
jgi:hypothetical protein